MYRLYPDSKLIRSVSVINRYTTVPAYVKDTDPKCFMADVFFLSKNAQDVLGLVDVPKNEVVGKYSYDENLEFEKIKYWEKHFCYKFSNEEEYFNTTRANLIVEDTPKLFWLCDHLRKGNKIDFPISQAWNRYYNEWETTVGNARLPAIKYFYKEDTIKVIRFKTSYCNKEIEWVTTFNDFNKLQTYYDNRVFLNFRAHGGSLIPGVHFYNLDTYTPIKLKYHNKLVKYCKRNKGLNLNRKLTLGENVERILKEL
jgi:hypothetical protein